MSIDDCRSESLQEPTTAVTPLLSPTREPSSLTRTAIEALVRDIQSAQAAVAIERAACAVLADLLEDFGRTYTYREVCLLPGAADVRSMPAVAARLRVIADRLVEQHGADQVMQVHHTERTALWVSFEVPRSTSTDEGSISYDELPVMLTRLGRAVYGRLPSTSRWAAPMVFPTL